MEKFFRPVHSPSGQGEMKLPKCHHPEDPESHRFTLFDDADVNQEENQGQRHRNGQYLHNSTHRRQTQQTHNEEDEILYDHGTPVTLSRASSSSLSSSSSSVSSLSWYTEANANDRFSLCHAERPQHSLSCSNIPDVRRVFREDDSSEPVVFATITHGSNGSAGGHTHGSLQQNARAVFSALDRSHSRSEEGLLKVNVGRNDRKQSKAPHSGHLYKASSLSRSLAFSDEDLVLGVSRGPKRAVSSSQLPGKGILKNKEPHADIRKAKSMEVLSPRVPQRQDPSGQKGTAIDQAGMERVRENFLQGKLQFSAFLDEITKQVISPSYLTMLGVNNNTTSNKTCAQAPTLNPVKPQLPPKKNRKNFAEEREQYPKHNNRQEKGASRKHSDLSNPDKLVSYAARSHQGSPPPHHYRFSPSHNANHGKNRKDKRMSPVGGSLSEDRHERFGPHLTDGTSTSPEPSRPKLRHHHSKQQTTAFHSPHTQHFPQPHQGHSCARPSTSPPSSAQGARMGLGSESSSSKSDSPRTPDTTSTSTGHSSAQSGRHHSERSVSSKQCRDRLCDSEQLHVLQEENTDLHQNLLQTVVCIESLESELQRTRDELSNIKEKYKSLLETHSGSRQANHLLGEHLHIAAESMSGERKYLLSRVSQLSSELEDAHRTIAALENINLPSLIKELLLKHFNSTEAEQKFLTPAAPASHSASSPPALKQPHTPKSEEAAQDRLTESENATAFAPFRKDAPKTGAEMWLSAGPLEDISTAIYEKIIANYAGAPQSIYPHNHQQSSLALQYTDSSLKHQQLHSADGLGAKGEVMVTLVEQDAVDVTSTSAQHILDEFMHKLHTREGMGEGKKREWEVGAEQQRGNGAE
ncbi:uncharacterized protein si:ch211-276i12.4 [Dunckerocampus dactyliophorus]|uniref:uncharacterized protein si:ch211-276i12.4 n=1 Tax=Dunckerocampus dactyliophorus TaxID=161453 RepID=UPI00240518F7|nr:uncharacterized protein si:ch211-276i12.4 [Dunckerocampus dactyliophorus]